MVTGFGTKCPEVGKAGERRRAAPRYVIAPPRRTAFSAALLGVHAVGIGVDRHLIEIVRTAPLQGNKLPNRGQIDMEHISVERHLPHIRAHVSDARLGHALLNERLLLLGHHDVQMDWAAALTAPHDPGPGASWAAPAPCPWAFPPGSAGC